jgi:hypothetical protein
LKWYEVILCKVVKDTSETLKTLDNYGVDYLLKLYEYLTYEEYVEAMYVKDTSIKRKHQNQTNKMSDLFKKLV